MFGSGTGLNSVFGLYPCKLFRRHSVEPGVCVEARGNSKDFRAQVFSDASLVLLALPHQSSTEVRVSSSIPLRNTCLVNL